MSGLAHSQVIPQSLWGGCCHIQQGSWSSDKLCSLPRITELESNKLEFNPHPIQNLVFILAATQWMKQQGTGCRSLAVTSGCRALEGAQTRRLTPWLPGPALPPKSCVTLRVSLNHSVPKSGKKNTVRSRRCWHLSGCRGRLSVNRTAHKMAYMCCYKSCKGVSPSVVSDSATPRTVACQAPLSMGLSRQEYWSGSPFLPDPGLNPGLLHCRQILYCLSHQGSPPVNPWSLSCAASTHSSQLVSSTSCIWKTCHIKPCWARRWLDYQEWRLSPPQRAQFVSNWLQSPRDLQNLLWALLSLK